MAPDAAVLTAMSYSLSSRFRRVHDELDGLRSNLEQQVRERTAALQLAQEDALAASRAKSEFLANMSHEIRTPMNGVMGLIDLTLGAQLGEQERRFLTLARSSASSLLNILNDILDLSRVETGRMHLEQLAFEGRGRGLGHRLDPRASRRSRSSPRPSHMTIARRV